MSLTVNIYYHGKNGSAKQFADEMVASGLVAEIRAKEGNLKYDYYLPYDDAETILLIDQWENQEALDAHHASTTMQKILNLRAKYKLTMTVYRFVDKQDEITENDRRFIN
jgi:quinol monooxygenase YgiN